MSIKESTMIVNLTISQWSARKFDKTATQKIESEYNAKESGRFNKRLLNSEKLKEIATYCGQVRNYHYTNTLPWGDNGDRILPTKNYFNYMMEMGKFKHGLSSLVDAFILEYHEEKEKSKERLQGLYNEADYPPVEMVRGKFGISTSFFPIADEKDFRVNMSEEIVEAMKEKMKKEVYGRVEAANNDLLERLRTVVGKMADTLAEENKKFWDSLVYNIKDTIELINVMNFNEDQRIIEAVKNCQQLAEISPEYLRNNRQYRKEIAAKASAIKRAI